MTYLNWKIMTAWKGGERVSFREVAPGSLPMLLLDSLPGAYIGSINWHKEMKLGVNVMMRNLTNASI